MQRTNKLRLLVIDDERDVCESIRKVAEMQGYQVYATDRPRDFRTAYESFQPDIVMVDIVMPDVDGVEILKQLADQRARAHVVMMTGYSNGYLARAVDLGRGLGLPSVTGVHKPLSVQAVREALDRLGRRAPRRPKAAAAR